MSTNSSKKRGLPASETKESDEPPSKRQKVTNKLIQEFQNTLQNDTFTDVQFIVGPYLLNKQTFNANKLLFSTHSKVFKAMLFGPLAQSTTEPIQIPDVKPLAFDYLHKLFYLKQPQLTFDIVVDVLYAAQKYLIDIVITECKQKLHSVRNLNDLYLILLSFQSYAPSVFEEIIVNFIESTQFISENIKQFIQDIRFITLQPYIVQNIIETDIFPTETMKYESIKKYCIKYQKHAKTEYNSWQSLFQDKFLKHIKLKRLSTEYLLSTIKNDDIISSDGLLEIINDKRRVGFKLSDVLLTYPQRMSLKVGDLVDIRDAEGSWYEAKVIVKTKSRIKLTFIGFNTSCDCFKNINEWQWIGRHKSVTQRIISRPCMKHLKKGNRMYVNCAYHPNRVGKFENKWTLARIVRRQKSSEIVINVEGDDYFMHADSQNECACLDNKCEYCYRYV